MDKLSLRVDGKIYSGWESASVTRSMEALAGTFSLGLSDQWSEQKSHFAISPGLSCILEADGEPLITGYIDDVTVGYDASSHGITVAGRDKTADLVDCSASLSRNQWRNIYLHDVIRTLISKFGLTVRVLVDTGARFDLVTIEQGETVFEVIDRLCRLRGVLASSNRSGDLILTRASKNRATGALVRGKNILSARVENNHRDRFSQYIVKGQQPSTKTRTPSASAGVRAQANDQAITRYRPLQLQAEQSVNSKAAYERAVWEANMRAARSRTLTINVVGWRDAAGKLWDVNHLVPVECDLLGLDQDMLISSVTYSKDASGTTAELGLVMPESYELSTNAGGASWLM